MKVRTPIPFLQTDKRRILLGAALAAAAAVICCLFYTPAAGLVFGLLFLTAGLLKLEAKHAPLRFLMNGFWAAACIFLSCLIPNFMVAPEANYLSIGAYRIVMNYLCVAVVYGLCLAITGRIRHAVSVGSGLLLILATINAFVFQFRGTLLKPMDILFVGTAMNVVGQYVFRIGQELACSWMLWLWMVFFLGALPEEDWIPRRWLRIAAALAVVFCGALVWRETEKVRIKNWSNEGATINGYYLNFTVGLRDFFMEAPEGYSGELIGQLEAQYAGQTPETTSQNRPNILVIMNESFADCDILGTDLRTNIPVTPFVDSLREDTIRGYALTSIFGGTTANAEFEFLTGLSMANAPEGSCPYQQYITGETWSLVHYLNALGYKTFATHPYFSSGWNRTNVYPRLGFSEMTFDEDYPYQDLIREFVSDREMYDYVLDALREDREEPLFLFGITMQNHGDYIYEGPNYEQTVFLEGYEMDHPMTEQYLTLLHESDKAVEYLLAELAEYPEDTVVLFFGDHFPQVEGDFFQEAHGGPYETLAEQQLQYSVPFFVWANYDIPEQEVACTSLNYLGIYLLEAAGIELPPLYRFLEEMEQRIPSLNANGYYSPAAGTYLSLDEAQGDEEQWLQKYAALQYNCMFDDDRSHGFFGTDPEN